MKAGADYFKEPKKSAGEVVGWWYRESRRDHFDYWLNHHAPHLLVLHDLDTSTSFWVHLTEENVVFLKEGAKVLVPADQTVDLEHAEALLAVASSRSRRRSWEGSSWAGAANISPTHLYRHALLVPRLIAPHPNRSVRDVIAAQATSLVILRREWRYGQPSKSEMPDLAEIDSSWDWDWQLAAGVKRWIESSDIGGLRDALTAASQPHQQAASTVALCAALMENDQPGEAADIAHVTIGSDRLGPIDHAWLRLQHARALYELGDWAPVRETAVELIALSARAPRDVTASAISGAAANLLFATADWEGIDFAQTVAATDTAAAWWRQQVVGWGLRRQRDEAFNAWAHDTSGAPGFEDAWDHLRAATLMAGFLGDHGSWRGAMEDLAKYVLTSGSLTVKQTDIENALDILRTAGAHQSLKKAARWIANNGPVLAVKNIADACLPSRSTVTTFHADLELLAAARDLLEPDHAATVVNWAIARFDEPTALEESLHPQFDVQKSLVELIADLVSVVPPDGLTAVLTWALNAVPEYPGLTAAGMRNLVNRIPPEVWTHELATRAAQLAEEAPWPLRYALLGAAAGNLPEVRTELEAQARAGEKEALYALGSVDRFDDQLVEDLIQKAQADLSEHSGGQRDQADAAGLLTLLSLRHPDHARWDDLCAWLDQVDQRADLAYVLERLARGAAGIPSEVTARLRPAVQRILALPPEDPQSGRIWPPFSAQASFLLAALDQLDQHKLDPASLNPLLSGDRIHRQFAALLCGKPDRIGDGLLTSLACDPDPHVRATAASVVAHRVIDGDLIGEALLPQLVQDPGIAVAKILAREAAKHSSRSLTEMLSSLRSHPSSQVKSSMESAFSRLV